MNLTMIGAILVLVMVVMAIWGRKIVAILFPESVIKRYALKAVDAVELLVVVTSDVKLKTAMEWAAAQLLSKWKLPVSADLLEYWIEWAVAEMKKGGREIKAEKVLPEDHPKILMQMSLRDQIKAGVGVEVKF